MKAEIPDYFHRAGYVAAACWAGQMFLGTIDLADLPGTAVVGKVMDQWWQNVILQGLWVLMAVCLLFFGAAVRAALRSGEAREATYSAVSQGAWTLAAAGLALMAWANQSAIGAAEGGDQPVLRTLAYLQAFGWVVLLIGLSAAYLAFGLGARASEVLPAWFAYITLVLGVQGLLGALHIPPGGGINYVLLPLWLAGASLLLGRSGQPRRISRLGVQASQA